MEKFIFTNGSANHAKNILTHLGVYDLFGREKVFDIEDAGYVPKPEAKTFDLMVKKFGINPKEDENNSSKYNFPKPNSIAVLDILSIPTLRDKS